MSRRQRIKQQRAIVTFIDRADGKVAVQVKFKPALREAQPASPAIQAAMEVEELHTQRRKAKA